MLSDVRRKTADGGHSPPFQLQNVAFHARKKGREDPESSMAAS